MEMFTKLVLLLTLSNIQSSEAGKILLFPLPMDSHYLYFSIAGQALKEQGHEVTMVTTPSRPWINKVDSYGIKLLTWKVAQLELTDIVKSLPEDAMKFTRAMMHSKANGVALSRASDNPVFNFVSYCTNVLDDIDLIATLTQEKFDLVVIDGIPMCRCNFILPYKLGVPYVTLSTFIEPWLARVPALPSFIPFTPGVSYPHSMTFTQRLKNLWAQLDWIVRPNMKQLLNDELVSRYVPERPHKTLTYLAGQSLLWLYNTDPLLDGPLPTMPNTIQIGGLTTGPAKPLTGELEKFVADSPNGFILVSFGSLLKMSDSPPELVAKLVPAFNLISKNIRIVWRNDIGSTQNLSSNILALPWLPQNDLLGHDKLRLFVTHCGNNGQFEALYHGVPMVGLPVVSDQWHNAHRMGHKGYGVFIDTAIFTAEQLVAAVEEVMTNQSYKKAVEKASRIYRSRRMHPKDKAASWISHVIKYGGSHLHSHALELPWYQYLMLDILLVFVLAVTVTLCVLMKCVRYFI